MPDIAPAKKSLLSCAIAKEAGSEVEPMSAGNG
jgi:hypothetical protein